jgi:fructose-bisphosphate aldolase, class I
MKISRQVKQILSHYGAENPGTLNNLARILMHGKLGGTGKLVILPVDQGFEHGPARSFAPNPAAYDPCYHYQLAVDAGLSAYAAPLGMLEVGAREFAGAMPTILKMNSANSLTGGGDQAVTASVADALRLGCSAIGFTIYPGSEYCYAMMEEFAALSREAKKNGLAVVLWSYARGGKVNKGDGETALDIIGYAAHCAALLGANIIKVKLPNSKIDLEEAKKSYGNTFDKSNLTQRVAHIVQTCFAGKRIVVFSGGGTKGDDELYDEVRSIRDGGGNGSIIGRNTFQRSKEDSLAMLDNIISIYKGIK